MIRRYSWTCRRTSIQGRSRRTGRPPPTPSASSSQTRWIPVHPQPRQVCNAFLFCFVFCLFVCFFLQPLLPLSSAIAIAPRPQPVPRVRNSVEGVSTELEKVVWRRTEISSAKVESVDPVTLVSSVIPSSHNKKLLCLTKEFQRRYTFLESYRFIQTATINSSLLSWKMSKPMLRRDIFNQHF